ncbi:acyl-CoA dehydrogenase [Pectobacteriaceae bacterium CE70]|nr:acyl-CoA dehydrogenase [Pectobacteriaceae bacterium C52]WJV65461.1 acyl-CoA dehydrogenase [Pectobacteriaceae bacterium CE70]WJY09480.1 acyl-CoA dehydrogenase [Pectobacteriaceae bacterium C80]WJY16562.1 acyl-CoA dehydrogenase [Pectobacteriaceae bacterium CE90]
MDFALTEEQELLLTSVRELISRDFPETYFKTCDEQRRFPREFFTALADSGISLLGIPEELGGVPADMQTQMLVLEEIARMGAPAYIMTEGQCIHNMRCFGNAEQLAKTAQAGLTGIPAYSLAFTEPQAGSDNNRIATLYTRKNGKVYLNGQKTFITGAKDLPYMLVLARNPEPQDPKRCFTLWWLDPNSPGVKRNDLHKVGWHMISNCEVFLDNVEVSEEDMVGREGWGFIHMMENFEIERLVIAAHSLGVAECAFEDAARYANQRVQFEKTIGQFQMIQLKLTQMAIKIQNMKNFVYRVAWECDNGLPMRLSAPMCKVYCAQSACEVVDDAMQILGGLGYTDDSRISRFWRDVRVNRIGGGTDEIMVYISARQILKQYEDK